MSHPAFVPTTALPSLRRSTPAVSRRSVAAPRMSLRKNLASLAAAAPATLATVAPVLATEGTGEGLGVDNALLFLPLLLIPAVFLTLFLQFDGSQDKEDFFGSYDERRN